MIDAAVATMMWLGSDDQFTVTAKAPSWASPTQSWASIQDGDCDLQIQGGLAQASCHQRYITPRKKARVVFRFLDQDRAKIKARWWALPPLNPNDQVPLSEDKWCLPKTVDIRFSPDISVQNISYTMDAATRIGKYLGVTFTYGGTTDFQATWDHFFNESAPGTIQVVTIPDDQAGTAIDNDGAWGGSFNQLQTGTVALWYRTVAADHWTYQYVIMHELLHVMGLGHAPKGTDSMMAGFTTRPFLTPADKAALTQAQSC